MNCTISGHISSTEELCLLCWLLKYVQKNHIGTWLLLHVSGSAWKWIEYQIVRELIFCYARQVTNYKQNPKWMHALRSESAYFANFCFLLWIVTDSFFMLAWSAVGGRNYCNFIVCLQRKKEVHTGSKLRTHTTW